MVTVDEPDDYDVVFSIKTGSTTPAIEAELLDNNGDPINLNGKSVKFVMKNPGTDTPKVDDFATILDPDNAIVAYAWDESDLDSAHDFIAEFQVDNQGDTGTDFNADDIFPGDGYVNVDVNEAL